MALSADWMRPSRLLQHNLWLENSHPIVARVPLHFGESQFLEERRRIHGESPSQSLFQSVPAADWVAWRARPSLDCALGCRLLFIGAASSIQWPCFLTKRSDLLHPEMRCGLWNPGEAIVSGWVRELSSRPPITTPAGTLPSTNPGGGAIQEARSRFMRSTSVHTSMPHVAQKAKVSAW